MMQTAQVALDRDPTQTMPPSWSRQAAEKLMGETGNGQNKTWLLNVLRWVAEVAVLSIGLTIWAWNLKTDQLIQANAFASYKEAQAKEESEARLRELAASRKYDELVDRYHDLREELVARGVIEPRRSRRVITNSGVREED